MNPILMGTLNLIIYFAIAVILAFSGRILFTIPEEVFRKILHFILYHHLHRKASLVPQTGKKLPAMQETLVQSVDQEYPLEKGMASHSSNFAWRIHGQRNLAGYCL